MAAFLTSAMSAKPLLILTALLAVAGCTFSSPGQQQPVFQMPLPSPQVSVRAIPNWKLYDSRLSAEFGELKNPFSLQYPGDWTIATERRGIIAIQSFPAIYESGGVGELPSGQFRIEIVPEWESGNTEDITMWCRKRLANYRNNEYSPVDILSEQKKIVGGFPAYVIDSRLKKDSQKNDRQVCIAKGDTKIGIVGEPLDPQYLPVFDQILFTLHFW